MGKKKGKKKEKQRKRVSAEWVYNDFYRSNHRRIHSVGNSIGDSDGESDTSVYGYLCLNPSVIPSVKSSEKNLCHHTIATFQTNCIGRWLYGRYIPTDVFCRYISTVSPMALFRRYIATKLEMELFPSVRITNEKIVLVIPLIFAGFLVVNQQLSQCPSNNKEAG